MSYYLGVDLGTTFTSAGVFRDGWVATAALSNHEPSTRSVVFVKEDGTILSGDTAARRGTTSPERVGREFKRRLGDPQPLFLGGSPYSAEQLTSRLLKFVLEKVDKAEGQHPAGVAISHPANWGPYKIDLLRQAVQMAGLPDTTVYLSEPEAAAIFYAEDSRLETGQTIAVYDLGGGTFDAAVLQKTEDGFAFLGKPVGIERLGGIDFDAAVFAHVTRVLGKQISELDDDDPAARMAVARLREDCTTAREALSDDNTVTIPVVLPNGSSDVRLTRAEYEGMIRPGLSETIDALRRALDSAQVNPQDLHGVLLVGGCSRTPLVAELISSELGCRAILCPDIIHAVALGGAHAAAAADRSQSVPVPPLPAVPAAVHEVSVPADTTASAEIAPGPAAPPRYNAATDPGHTRGNLSSTGSRPGEAPVASGPPPRMTTPPASEGRSDHSPEAAPMGSPMSWAPPTTSRPGEQAQPPLPPDVPLPAASGEPPAPYFAPTPPLPNSAPVGDPPQGQRTFDQLAATQDANSIGRNSAAAPMMVELTEDVSNRSRRGVLVAGVVGALVILGLGGVFALTRGGDDAEVTTAAETEPDDGVVDAVEVDSSVATDEQAADTQVANLVVSTVDLGSMAEVSANTPTIGTNTETSRLSPPEFASEAEFDGDVHAYVDRRLTTNIQFYDFASFTAAVSEGDPDQVWAELVPDTWLVNLATLPTDFEEIGLPAQDQVQGLSWDAADRYCSYALKRMPTEVEWELAAVGGSIDFSSSQNWVSEPESYGSVPNGATVVRGSSGPDDSSAYHRTISASGADVPAAGVRCAADDVNEIPRPSGELLYSRIFGGEDEPRDWPDLHDPMNVDAVFGYHSPDVFHIEVTSASTVAVSSTQLHAGDTEVSMEVELRKPKAPSGWFRYGLLTRSSADGALTFMVHPQVNDDGMMELAWCASKQPTGLITTTEIYGIQSSAYSTCDLEGVAIVENFRNNIAVRFDSGTAEFFIEGSMVGSLVHDLPQDGEFGVVSESFEDDPLTHIHFDNLVVKTS